MGQEGSAETTTPQAPLRRKRKYQYIAFLWILPAFLLMLVFSYYPPINSLLLSFTDSNNGLWGNWIWFQNYAEILSDSVFWISLKNVLILTAFGLIVGNVMTILLAELLYNCHSQRAAAVYRFIFILTILVPNVVNLLIWQNLIFSAEGVANAIVTALGGSKQTWYFGENTALISIMLTGFPWVGGTSFLIYLAGLQNIPPEIVEAGRLDGLTTFKRVFYIDFPFLMGQIKYFLILGIIGGIQNFNMQLIVTGSGPGTSNATNVPGFYLYEFAFTYGQFGKGAAVGMIIFVLTLAATIVNMTRMKTTEEVME